MSHIARLSVDPENRVVMHCHPTHTLAMNYVHELDEKALTHTLWEMCTECIVVFPGMEAEYKRRHDALWPEMAEMIHRHGEKNYSIFLDGETNTLFGYLEIESEELWARSADTEVCRRWWHYMKDLMETNPDESPVSIDLAPVFHLD